MSRWWTPWTRRLSTVRAARRRSSVCSATSVAEGGERILLDRRGKSVAALVPIEDLELLREIEDQLDNAAAAKAGKESGRIDWSALKRDLDL